MGFADWIARRKGYVKPEEMKPAKRRSFSASQVGRLTNSWTTTPKPIDTDIQNGLRRLVARSREQSINNDYVRRFFALTKSNVVGPNGITLQGKIVDNNGETDKLANKALEEGWQEFGRYGNFDVTGQHSFVSACNLFIETVAKDGEVLAIIHNRWKYNKFRFAIEFIDTQSLDVEFNKQLDNGNVIKMGVELNAWRRPVAYHLTTTSKTAYDYEHHGKRYKRIPAEYVIHRFLPEAAFQTRGFPWTVSSMMRLNMLAGYEESELVAARVASSKMGFFTSDVGSNAEYTGEETDENGNIITEAEPGTFEQLPEGVRLETFDPSHPANAYETFIKATLRGAAAGLGVSYFTLANDLENVNYSSGRLGTLEDREIWKAIQKWMVDCWCYPIFNAWLENALLTESLTVAGKPLKASRIDKYKKISWQPRRWAWTDPQKEMSAYKTGVEENFISVSAVIREQGRDPDEVYQEIADDKRRFKELNIEPIKPGSPGFLMGEGNEASE